VGPSIIANIRRNENAVKQLKSKENIVLRDLKNLDELGIKKKDIKEFDKLENFSKGFTGRRLRGENYTVEDRIAIDKCSEQTFKWFSMESRRLNQEKGVPEKIDSTFVKAVAGRTRNFTPAKLSETTGVAPNKVMQAWTAASAGFSKIPCVKNSVICLSVASLAYMMIVTGEKDVMKLQLAPDQNLNDVTETPGTPTPSSDKEGGGDGRKLTVFFKNYWWLIFIVISLCCCIVALVLLLPVIIK
jgi:hypothetical protein